MGRRKEANEEAIDLLRKAIAIDPTYSRAHALLAWCHVSNAAYLSIRDSERELSDALASVDAAGSIGDDPTALTAAGAAVSMCSDQNRAKTFIERALSLDPNNAWAWARYGWIAMYQDQEPQATERFQRAINLSPRDPLSFNMKLGMATSLAKAGSYAEAIAMAREVLASHPDVILAYRYLAAWVAMQDDMETARWAAQKLLAAQPDFTIRQYIALPFFTIWVRGAIGLQRH